MQLMGDPSAEASRALGGAGLAGRPGEAYLRYAGFLADRDRLVLELCYRRGMTRTEIGRLVGQSPGTVSRRIARLTARLRDPIVVRLIESPEGAIPAEHRAIGIGHYLCGLSASRLAKRHAIGRRAVQDVIAYLRGWGG